MKCETCKYFAVPLSDEEKGKAHCPGADPFGEISKKVCTLRNNPDFDPQKLDPESCHYYFPIFMRWR
jgi:hypothetical protein